MKALPRLRLALAGLLFTLAPSLSSAQAPAAKKGVVAALQPFVDSQSLAGAVTLVADKDKVLAVDTVGYMDVAAKKPMRPDALFWIASMSKPITATAFMILVDEGKVSLDDPVEKYIPEFKGRPHGSFEGKGPECQREAEAGHRDTRHPQPHQRIALQVRGGSAHARWFAASRCGEELCGHAADLRARHAVQVLQRGHQHRGEDHRDRERHPVRGVPR